MKKTDNRNPIYYAAQEIWDSYGEHLSGLLSGAVCVVSESVLGDVAKNALSASMDRLGYVCQSITFVCLSAHAAESEQTPLSSEQLFAVVEGIDPFVLIATDSMSINALSHAYNSEFTPKKPARLFGRDAVGFIDFESMLDDTKDKRKAWEHLKLLGEAPKAI